MSSEFVIHSGTSSPMANRGPFLEVEASGIPAKIASGQKPFTRPPVVVYQTPEGAGQTVDPNQTRDDFNRAVAQAALGRPVSPQQFAQPYPTSSEPVTPASGFVLPQFAPPATPSVASAAATTTANQDPMLYVTFQRNNGDSFESMYHDVIQDEDFLTLVYDHNQRQSVLYRPGASEEPLLLSVGDGRGSPLTFSCYATGFRFRHRNCEYQVFTIERRYTS